ncbi:GDSL esterase/lipase APG-like [Curcuma longa]|uniref:GDSL esterase/lipase APG-like n=1 Tax=Curcuma longa TaxID=136217 RepID=UPI003D9ECEE3
METTDAGTLARVLALALFLLRFVGGGAQPLVPAIFTFGDSAVDVGNNDYLTATFRSDYPPYGKDFTNHQATGRFSNGKLATDFTADTLGFTSYAPPYLSPQASGSNLLIGASFASAGSGFYDGTADAFNAITLPQQLKYFREYRSRLAAVAGNSTTSSIISGALYLLCAGTADFVQNYFSNPALSQALSPAQFSSLLVGSYAIFIRDLYGLGARRIGVTNLGPLGCLPATISLFGGSGSDGCVSHLNEASLEFNRQINASTASLARQLPDLKIAVFDLYQPLYDLVTKPADFGFFESRKACCTTGTVKTSRYLCIPRSTGMCPNATGYVFWDTVHPTDAANQVLSDSFLGQGSNLIF